MAVVVKSAVKAHVAKSKMRVSGDFWGALDKKIAWKVKPIKPKVKKFRFSSSVTIYSLSLLG